MFNGLAASYVSHGQDRSKYVRYNSDPESCHPTQRTRSSLGVIHGAVYIPVEDNKSTLGGQCRTYTSSVPPALLTFPVLEDFKQQTESAPSHQDGVIDDNNHRAQFRFADQSPDPEPNVGHTMEEEVPEDSKGRIGSIGSTLNSSGSSPSSHTGPLLRPHFASSAGLKVEPESYLLNDGDQSESAPFLRPLKRNSISLSHDHVDDHDKSREELISSASSYPRTNASLAHRDTLARIKHIPNTTVSSSTSLAVYPASAIESLPSSLLARHRDTFARINFRRRPALPVPKVVFERLLHYLTFDEYKALRLTCRIWLPSLPPPRIPASYQIPAEILQEIYSSLSPLDFDAARHTCKSWFLASLDRRLLVTMSRRAGCYGNAQADLQARQEHSEARRRSMNGRIWADHYGRDIEDCHQPELDDLVSEEWVYSKRLALESMLSPDWRGISLKHSSTSSTDASERMTPIGTVEFSLVPKSQRRSSDSPSPMPANTFTISGCGKFVLITRGRVVYVCELLSRKPGIQPLTRIVCPRKVLGVSMDTSSKRYAVAILLEGRVGMCCSLTDGFGEAVSRSATSSESMELGMSADVRGSNSASSTIRPTLSALPLRRAEFNSSTPAGQFYVSRASEAIISPASETAVASTPDSSWLDDTFDRYNPREQHPDGEEEAISRIGIPIEQGPRTIYNNLCSFDDPPISVAICPQRRCVAFGCRMGIELHWVDALTGSDLSRWFPLAAPSNFLYFLPARHGVDSAKKLRLISSAAGPYAQLHTSRAVRGSSPSKLNWRNSPNGSRRQSMTRLFFGNLPFPTSTTLHGLPGALDQEPGTTSPEYAEREHGVLRTVDCDHYRAMPLSDGAHLLFTDPETGHLCLGSDAPLGGPTKLLRKVVFLPPNDKITMVEPQEQYHPTQSPLRLWLMCYASGSDLRWGVRVVAAYSDGRIMLYCIPSDVFGKLKSTRTGIDVWDERAGVIGQSDLLMDQFMPGIFDTAHGNASTSSHAANEAGAEAECSMHFSRSRPLKLRGVEIRRVSGEIVEDIAVSCDFGGLRVWAFMQSGLVRMWNLFRRVSGPEDRWIVETDGIVRRKEKADNYEGVSPTAMAGVPVKREKGKERSTSEGQDGQKRHIRWSGSGMDGTVDEDTDRTVMVKQDPTSTTPPNERHQSENPPSFVVVTESTASVWRLDWDCPSYGLDDVHDRLEITILSDWRGVQLLDPYTVLLE